MIFFAVAVLMMVGFKSGRFLAVCYGDELPRMFNIILFAFLLMAGECRAQDCATYSIEQQGQRFEISIERTSTHPRLAEYDRFLKIRVNGVEKAALKMFPDTGGTVLVNTRYDSITQRILLKDRIGCYLIDLSTAVVSEICSSEMAHWSFVGAFDEAKGKHWRFFPVSERSEQAIPSDEEEG
jgi:hypothetical protein